MPQLLELPNHQVHRHLPLSKKRKKRLRPSTWEAFSVVTMTSTEHSSLSCYSDKAIFGVAMANKRFHSGSIKTAEEFTYGRFKTRMQASG